jgi:hypothetical protein
MLEQKTIERFLANNSSVNPQSVMGNVVQANLKTRYRPDKLFIRDGYMKWDMIFNGIDTPHRMPNRATMAQVDRTWLATELNELKDFKI